MWWSATTTLLSSYSIQELLNAFWNPFEVEAEVQGHEESWVSNRFGCTFHLRCLHRLHLILTEHEKVFVPKNENTLALAFIRLLEAWSMKFMCGYSLEVWPVIRTIFPSCLQPALSPATTHSRFPICYRVIGAWWLGKGTERSTVPAAVAIRWSEPASWGRGPRSGQCVL